MAGLGWTPRQKPHIRRVKGYYAQTWAWKVVIPQFGAMPSSKFVRNAERFARELNIKEYDDGRKETGN